MPKIDFAQVITAEAKAKAEAAAMVQAIRSAVDGHVDETAKAKGYNSAAHCASYVKSTVPAWAAEAETFIAWRDAVWLTVFEMMEFVLAGENPAPENPAQVVEMLPEIKWP